MSNRRPDPSGILYESENIVGAEQTADHSYLPIHDRNYDIWYLGEKEDDHRLHRFNYLCKRYQLDPWVPHIKEIPITRKKTSRPGFEPGLKAFRDSSAGLRDVHYPIGTTACHDKVQVIKLVDSSNAFWPGRSVLPAGNRSF